MNNTRLLEHINIVSAFPPQDLNSDADGDWVSLKNYHGCLVVVHKAAGTAGDDISLKMQQATAVAGTAAKALTFNHVYAKVGATALSAIGTFTKYSGTATDDLDTVSTFGTDILSDVGESLFVVDIKASDLDVTNGFDCIQLSIEGDDLSNAALGAAFYILYGPRQAGATPLTAIAD
jgi:hypothetical protein